LANLYERVKRHPNGTPSFKQGKHKRLRLKHRQFSDLVSHTGVTYSSSSNQVYATEEVWKMFNKVLDYFIIVF